MTDPVHPADRTTEAACAPATAWSVAIFAAREDLAELQATIAAIVASARQATCIDLMVNGNPALAEAAAQALPQLLPASGAGHLLRVWQVPMGGKAHAWNQYVHQVWPGSDLAFFADGYVRPEAQTMGRLATLLDGSPDALAATGMPLTGGTASLMQRRALVEGALHGNFFALKRSTMTRFRADGFTLPLGLYGFDTVLGGVLGFGADPGRNPWDPRRRIASTAEIRWHTPEKHWWRPGHLKTQFNRIQNNALRELVRQATKHHLARHKRPPGQLPKTVEAYVLEWAADRPDELRATLRRAPLCRLALKRLQQPRDWSRAQLPPKLLRSSTTPGA